MNKDLIDIINSVSSNMYARMTDKERKAYMLMNYIGISCRIMGANPSVVAYKIGYSYVGTVSIVQKWSELFDAHNQDVVGIAKVFANKFPRYKERYHELIRHSFNADTILNSANEQAKVDMDAAMRERDKGHSLGFVFTDDENRAIKRAIRASKEFMLTYGRGEAPRTRGEYYSPVCAAPNPEDGENWLPLAGAARHCGCNRNIMRVILYNEGALIRRKLYFSRDSHRHMVYNVRDLNAFIERRRNGGATYLSFKDMSVSIGKS